MAAQLNPMRYADDGHVVQGSESKQKATKFCQIGMSLYSFGVSFYKGIIFVG